LNRNAIAIACLLAVVLFFIAWKAGLISIAIGFLVKNPKLFLIMLLPTPIPDFGLSFFMAFIIGMILPKFAVSYIYNIVPFRKKLEGIIPDRFEKYIARIIAGYIITTIIALGLLIFCFNEPISILFTLPQAP